MATRTSTPSEPQGREASRSGLSVAMGDGEWIVVDGAGDVDVTDMCVLV